MKTEDEARKTRCCGPLGCGTILPEPHRMCVASECMAWRWDAELYNKFTGKPLSETARSGNYPIEWRQTTDGYCGLAETPRGRAAKEIVGE